MQLLVRILPTDWTYNQPMHTKSIFLFHSCEYRIPTCAQQGNISWDQAHSWTLRASKLICRTSNVAAREIMRKTRPEKWRSDPNCWSLLARSRRHWTGRRIHQGPACPKKAQPRPCRQARCEEAHQAEETEPKGWPSFQHVSRARSRPIKPLHQKSQDLNYLFHVPPYGFDFCPRLVTIKFHPWACVKRTQSALLICIAILVGTTAPHVFAAILVSMSAFQ